jgi:Tol biopolymer transport system component
MESEYTRIKSSCRIKLEIPMIRTPALVLASLLIPSLWTCYADPPATTEPTDKQGRILIWKQGKSVLLTPEGKQISEAASDRKKYTLLTPDGKTADISYPEKASLTDPCFSSDGKHVAFIAHESPPFDRDFNYLRSVFVHGLGGKGEGIKLEITAQNLAWTPDGKLLAVEAASSKDVSERKFTTWLVDVGTKEKSRIELPEGTQVFAATPDGKSFIATTYDAAEKKIHLASISRDGKNTTKLTEFHFVNVANGPFSRLRLSPDGTRILFVDIDREEKLPEGASRFPRLYLYDTKTQKRERLADIPLDALVWDFAWAPDSKRVAYIWKRMEPGVPLALGLDKDGKPKENPKLMTETETHLNVADANGKNTRTILSAKAPSGPAITMSKLEWR